MNLDLHAIAGKRQRELRADAQMIFGETDETSSRLQNDATTKKNVAAMQSLNDLTANMGVKAVSNRHLQYEEESRLSRVRIQFGRNRRRKNMRGTRLNVALTHVLYL